MATHWTPEDEEKLFWYLAAAYLADLGGQLDPTNAAKLTSFEAAAGTMTWQEHVRETLGMSEPQLRRVLTICGGKETRQASLSSALRCLGCPDPQARASEVLG